MKKLTIALAVLSATILITVCPASAVSITQINLNDFYADDTVMVAVDGLSAILAEDPEISPVLLINDPGFSPPDPEIIIAGLGTHLLFDFDFNEPADNDDEFGAFLFDADTGLDFTPAFQFFIEETDFGTVSFDLSTLIGKKLGLQFQLFALEEDPYSPVGTTGDSGLDSTVIVSNVRLVSPVPEPTTILLLATGLFGILGLRRRKFHN